MRLTFIEGSNHQRSTLGIYTIDLPIVTAVGVDSRKIDGSHVRCKSDGSHVRCKNDGNHVRSEIYDPLLPRSITIG